MSASTITAARIRENGGEVWRCRINIQPRSEYRRRAAAQSAGRQRTHCETGVSDRISRQTEGAVAPRYRRDTTLDAVAGCPWRAAVASPTLPTGALERLFLWVAGR